ncbi:hypothetical protein BANRA_04345 [Escherichia coli]|nr:hypothetical protein BANRA_03321 [Escherichia coli]VCY94343.1 hypothetical protein BANRA_02799 [Escherichia coli]VDL34696.1 hypothetical protein BANRA_04345 [Escherichia coli]
MDSKLMDYDYLASRFQNLQLKPFAVNEFYRNNDDFINPDLQERLVIGDDSISIFTYDIKSNFLKLEIILAQKIYSVRLVISLHS